MKRTGGTENKPMKRKPYEKELRAWSTTVDAGALSRARGARPMGCHKEESV